MTGEGVAAAGPPFNALTVGSDIQRRIGVKTSRDEPLARFTTMRVGGPADLFAVAHNLFELRGLVRYARARSFPLFLLGRGSDLVIADAGIRGLVVQVRAEAIDSKDVLAPPNPAWPCGGCPGCGGANRKCGLVAVIGNTTPGLLAGVFVIRRRRLARPHDDLFGRGNRPLRFLFLHVLGDRARLGEELRRLRLRVGHDLLALCLDAGERLVDFSRPDDLRNSARVPGGRNDLRVGGDRGESGAARRPG